MDEKIEAILASINPKLRKKISTGDNVETHKQKTPSLGLTSALRGGFAYGRQVLLWGTKSAGKSSFCLQLIAMAQKDGKTCAWVDAEGAFDESWAAKLGVDTESLIYSEAKTINDMVDVSTQLISAGVDILVVDSISALLPAVYFQKDSSDLKQLEDTKQIGAEARDMTNAVKMLNYVNNQNGKTLIILISQVRKSLGSYMVGNQPTGGMAVKFFSSTIVKLWSSESDNNAIKGTTPVGNRLLESKVGRKVTWTIDFNKTGPAFLSGDYDFYFDGGNYGIDKVAELVDLAESQGVIEKGGAWYTVLGERFQGRAKVIEYVKNNPDKLKELEQQIV